MSFSPSPPTALLLKFPGTNCDAETARALEGVGFTTRILPTAELTRASLDGVDLVVLSGGFSYGDYVQSGRFSRLRIEQALGPAGLKDFVARGGFVVGICNGFQILTELGLLPEASLIDNSSGRFQCRWVKLKVRNRAVPALRHLPDEIEFPIAHAEGRLVTREDGAELYVEDGNGALLYADDVNGSAARIAGLADDTGRVFGLMPHPERFVSAVQHYDPDWGAQRGDRKTGWGHDFFRGIFEAVSEARTVVE